MKVKIVLIGLILISSVMPQLSMAQEIVISGNIRVYIHPDESPQVRRAVEDLQRDLKTVLGQPSLLVTALPKKGAVIVIATGDRYTGTHSSASGWETHQVYVENDKIILNGADMRGTIYAIYTFSELVLGVKPLWFWASEPPQRKDKIKLPGNYRKVFSSPSIRYRAWFPNDRDLLDPWQARSDENYEAFYEAMLRLKVNTLEGGVTDSKSFEPPYLAGREATVAQKRGLIVTGHHMLVFGSSFNSWDSYWEKVRSQPVPKLTLTDRQSLREFWSFHIDLALQNKLEVIWLVGFRGNRDIPFWEFFPDSPADEQERAKVIEEMVNIQIDLLKEKTKKANPLMRLTLYNEMSTLVAKNFFHIPKEDSLIHNFVAARRDHFPAADIRNYTFTNELVGYYLNFQFTSSGSHLAQAEGPKKMEQNFRMVDSLAKGNLIFSVVNAGNIREHVLELSANADMMWNFKTFRADSFLKEFTTTYYDPQHSNEIASLYHDFFNSYWQQKKGDIPGFERQYLFQDMRYARAAEMLLTDLEAGKYRPDPLEGHPMDNPDKGSIGYFRVIPADNSVANQLEAIIKGTSESISKLEAITSKADRIYPQLQTGQLFFDDNLRGQAYVMLHLNRMLNYLARAYQYNNDPKQRLQFIQQSLVELRFAQQRLQQSGHGIFRDWYFHDEKFGIKIIVQRLENLEAKLKR